MEDACSAHGSGNNETQYMSTHEPVIKLIMSDTDIARRTAQLASRPFIFAKQRNQAALR